MMDVESTDDSTELIQNLADRIEEIERTLHDDEHFCMKDIDTTYEAAEKYLETFVEKFNEKLLELRLKLNQTRDENIKICKQNKKQFDDEIDEVNQLFSSGKHQEALEKFQNYEKSFPQRTVVIQNIPKLYMNEIDINQYFSIDKPIDNKRDSFENIKPFVKSRFYSPKPNEIDSNKKDNHDHINEQELNKNTQSRSPLSTTSTRPVRISMRLPPSPPIKSPSVSEKNRTTPLSAPATNLTFQDSILNNIQVQSTPSSPNVNPSLSVQHRTISVKDKKGEGLTTNYVAYYKYDSKLSLLMACDKTYIILFKFQNEQSIPQGLAIIERSNRIEQDLGWNGGLITSIGFINKNYIYIFTEYDFTIYSLSNFSIFKSWIIRNTDSDENSKYTNGQCLGIGTVYDGYIYIIDLNNKSQQTLSIYELETMKFVNEYNLSLEFADVTRFIHMCITKTTVNILVQMDSYQYGVIVLFNINNSSSESNRLIPLSYANNPLTICSIYIDYLKRDIFFINDPSAKIIHILTNEKYLQSYAIIAYTLISNEENHELLLATNNGIYSIDINAQRKFFSKYSIN